jgi:hypothetical protein
MGTTDSKWVSILLLSLLIAAGCGGVAGEANDGLLDPACELDDECDEFAGDELADDGALDEERPNDDAPGQQDQGPVEPPTYDEGQNPTAPANPSGGRTAPPPSTSGGGRTAPPPNTSEGRGAPPPNSSDDRTPATPSPDTGRPDPALPTPECTPGESRCVAGDPGVVEQCDANGLWTTVSCGTAELCTDSACTLACELSVEPSDSYVCYVPNKDGVNDGVLWASNDPDRMENGIYTGIQVHYTEQMRAAPIRRVPDDIFHAGSWPYEWKLESEGQLRQALIEFRLDQFSSLPGPLRNVDFTYWARRAPAFVIPDPYVAINYETRALVFARSPGAGAFATDSAHVLGYAYFASEITTRSIPAVFGSNKFDHAGQVNDMGIEIVGDAAGNPPMDAYVNFVMLTVR